jgi:hypothetical protein
MRNEWKKPQLVIVTRGSSEENVLTSCKGANTSGSPSPTHGSCQGDLGACYDCETISIS